ncbi:pentatricopeptide repeat-containing protein [Senna tora]|uniref:Pentatricopeptide repeat-containing protein n=1 Tax=Senna tora TaxID=362788 RepID=A0A834X2R3_9FABA|nr:pentatricopeptide repeat-containing protein [Senna tora]
MDLMNSLLNLVVPPTSLMMVAFAWPGICFLKACEWLTTTLLHHHQDMEDRVQIAYEYGKRRANLVLVARREQRLVGIAENARLLGANHVITIAADVVKEDDCTRFVQQTIQHFGRVDHLVNTVSLGHTFYFDEVADTSVFPLLLDINFWGNVYPTFVALPYLRQTKGRIIINASVENWLPLPRMSLYAAAKAALVNFYETLRFELNDEVGVTIATHGWIGSEMISGKFMVEEGAEMQWKEEREVHVSGESVEEFARLIVSGACRGDAYVKFPSWYDIFLLFRVFTPNILNWAFKLLISPQGVPRTSSLLGTGRPVAEMPPPPGKALVGSGPVTFSGQSSPQMQLNFFWVFMETSVPHLANLLQNCISKKALLAGKVLHARIFRLSLFSDTLLCNHLIELYSKCDGVSHAYQVFCKIPQRNIYSWNAILGAYCRDSNLRDAYKLFVQMPERNTVSWNTIISTMVRTGFEQQALYTFDSMMLEGLKPSHITFASIFSACAALSDAEFGRRSHGLVVKVGLDKNLYAVNALLCMYSKCELISDAIRVFKDIPDPNEVTFTTMMGGLARTNQVREASEVCRLMLRKGIHIDSVSLSTILGVCSKGGFEEIGLYGKEIHTLSIKLGFEKDLHLNNSLLDMYAKTGDMDSAENVFANMLQLSVVSWNIMISGYGNKCKSDKALEYLQRMQSYGFEPDDVTYINMLAACVKSGDVSTGRYIFDSMSCPSLTSWNAMLSGYIQNADHKEAVELFRKMQFQWLHPDRTTLAIILSSCAEMGLLEAGKEVHACSQKSGLHNDAYVASGLINVYSKCGEIELAKHIFNKLPELDVVCWNSMIVGFSINSLDDEAFTFYKQMREFAFIPSEFSYASILNSCAKLSSLLQGQQIHAQITKDGLVDDIFVGSSLIEMYCKCGGVDGARCFFDMMPFKNTVTWNAMIHGYAHNGCGNEAVSLYKEMIQSGEKPDDITFVAVLTACSHSALVDEGVEIFNSMQQKYGTAPMLDHYTCIIDCLGRAGRFDEAEVILDSMPYKDDPVVWEVVLSSCRIHANLNLARRAAEELFRLDPQNSASYVLLANMYSSMGRWDDARHVRDMMSDKQVRKDPGYSWSECKEGMENSDLALIMVNSPDHSWMDLSEMPAYCFFIKLEFDHILLGVWTTQI